MDCVIITNNDIVIRNFSKDKESVIFTKKVNKVFEIAREYIMHGYHFYIHPLSLNIDVHKIPVKSLVLTEECQCDMDEIALIDGVLKKDFRPYNVALEDFKEIDAEVINDALKEVRK